MPSENVPAWAMEKARECLDPHLDLTSTFVPVEIEESVARALASAHAAGEEKGRREMLDRVVSEVGSRRDSARRLAADHPDVAAIALVVADEHHQLSGFLRTLPTTPPTPNPLPATGGEE